MDKRVLEYALLRYLLASEVPAKSALLPGWWEAWYPVQTYTLHLGWELELEGKLYLRNPNGTVTKRVCSWCGRTYHGPLCDSIRCEPV